MDTESQLDEESTSPNFDELNNEIKRNLWIFVPFITRKYEPLDPSDQTDEDNQKRRFKAPPLKRICARDEAPINESSDEDDSNDKLKKRVTNSKTGQVYYKKWKNSRAFYRYWLKFTTKIQWLIQKKTALNPILN